MRVDIRHVLGMLGSMVNVYLFSIQVMKTRLCVFYFNAPSVFISGRR